jgi:phosphoglycolate phosphatase
LTPAKRCSAVLALQRRFDAAIIDLDGTLLHTLPDFAAALARTLADLQLPAVALADVERDVGKGSEHLVAQVLATVGAPPSLLATALPLFLQHYAVVNGQAATVYPGVMLGLQALQAAGLPLACLTNKPTAYALPLLAAQGLAPYFVHVFGGDAFARKKPDPLPVLQTCAALGTTPARTLVVGDSSNDAAAARGAGCPCVLVSYGYNHGHSVADAGAQWVLHSLADLPGLLV